METPDPVMPDGLAARGRQLWSDVLARYVLDAGEVALLVSLCCAVDVEDRLVAEAAEAPLTMQGSRGQEIPHPVFGMLRAQVKLIASLERSLALPQSDGSVERRRSANARHAANVRWNRGKSA